MSVIEQIKNREYTVTKGGFFGYIRTPDSKEAEDKLLRLAKLGAEAERAINACFKQMQRYEVGDGCVWEDDDSCDFAKVCKMVREGNHG